METRICKQCGIEKPLADFEKYTQRGKLYYRWRCKNCTRDERNLLIKKYRKRNPEKQKEMQKRWVNQNRGKLYAARKEKRKNDEVYKCVELLRNRIWKVFNKKGMVNSPSLEKVLCCTTKNFYEHLLRTFFENYGERYDGTQKVNIDHIVPLATAKTKEDVYNLFHYSNLQLLTATDNGKKWCKLSYDLENKV